ncbi:hypothetical protein IQ13_2711 [Lacibacter cauensis]|uniref:Uncharacterized protein n=1 Tax=Lacibacter cauensis TaxID=510947 RepID=A0A562SKH4_9BACT|nr:hypothetical protein IQ13_2711 [Lacibacter cauensis]
MYATSSTGFVRNSNYVQGEELLRRTASPIQETRLRIKLLITSSSVYASNRCCWLVKIAIIKEGMHVAEQIASCLAMTLRLGRCVTKKAASPLQETRLRKKRPFAPVVILANVQKLCVCWSYSLLARMPTTVFFLLPVPQSNSFATTATGIAEKSSTTDRWR